MTILSFFYKNNKRVEVMCIRMSICVVTHIMYMVKVYVYGMFVRRVQHRLQDELKFSHHVAQKLIVNLLQRKKKIAFLKEISAAG